MTYLIADSLVVTLSCRGQALWRTFAEPWQIELSKHGRVTEDQPGELTIIARCVNGAAVPYRVADGASGQSVEEPPNVGN